MKRFICLFAALLAIVVSPGVRAADSAPLSDEAIAAIRSGCPDALQSMLKIEKVEAATRVNRGREYEALLELVAAFNSRVVQNRLDAPLLTGTAAQLQTEFNDFSRHYISYADKLDAALDINCKEAPVTFYDALNAAREARGLVAADINTMDELLGEYQRGLDGLKAQLKDLESTAP